MLELTKDKKFEDARIPKGMKSVLSMFRFAKGARYTLAFSLFLIFLSVAFVSISGRLLGGFVEAMTRDAALSVFLTYILWIMILEIAALVVRYYGRLWLSKAMNHVTLNIRMELFYKAKSLPLEYFEKNPVGRTLTRMTHDVEGIEQFFGGTLANLLLAYLSIFVIFVAMLSTDFNFACLVILSSLPALFTVVMFRQRVLYWLRKAKSYNSQIASSFAESYHGMSTLKLYNLNNWAGDKIKDNVDLHFEAQINTMSWNAWIRPTAVFFASIPVFFILFYGGGLVLEEALGLGVFVAFLRYSERFLQPIVTVMQEIQVLQEATTSSERVNEMLREATEDEVLFLNGNYKGILKGKIEFEGVDFYFDRSKPVLQNISFTIEAGQKIGLVGVTGSGKSTIINLICALIASKRGRIRIDDVDIRNWDRFSLRSQIGIVSQEVMIFRGTLRDNLKLVSHNSKIDDASLVGLCSKLGLKPLLERAGSLDFVLQEFGSNISQGEKQLISIIRMILKDPAILILDEATSSLDQKAEELVQEALDVLMQGRTCISIAHRTSTLKNCDEILLLQEAKILRFKFEDFNRIL